MQFTSQRVISMHNVEITKDEVCINKHFRDAQMLLPASVAVLSTHKRTHLNTNPTNKNAAARSSPFQKPKE